MLLDLLHDLLVLNEPDDLRPSLTFGAGRVEWEVNQ